MSIEHKNAALTKRHAPHNWEYADAAARTAATGFVAGDVGKLARQLDDNSLWMLTDDSPVTWQEVGGGGGGTTINATDGAIPYRSSSTAFSDSPLHRAGASIVGIGGTTSSFPALKRSSTELHVRRADDSAYTFVNMEGFRTTSDGRVGGIGGDPTQDIIYLRADSAAGYIAIYGSGGAPSIRFTNTANAENGHDSGIARVAAGVVEVHNGTPGQTGVLLLRGRTFANLPASPIAGMQATVTDSSTATWGATITGGGANVVLAFYNGTNWTVAGK